MFSDVDDMYVTECELPQFAPEVNYNYFEPTFPQKRPEPSGPSDVDDESAYEKGTREYKKARKRRQNRESAMRARMRRRIQDQSIDGQIENLKHENSNLQIENAQLKTENELLKSELAFYRKMHEEGESSTSEDSSFKVAPKGIRPSWFALGLFATLVIFALLYPMQGTKINTGQRKLLSIDDAPGDDASEYLPLLAFAPMAFVLAYKSLKGLW